MSREKKSTQLQKVEFLVKHPHLIPLCQNRSTRPQVVKLMKQFGLVAPTTYSVDVNVDAISKLAELSIANSGAAGGNRQEPPR